VSPADGQVVIAGDADPRWSPPGPWKQITIFLSPMDVHMNRTPVGGRVTRVESREGKFLPAYKQEASENELNEIWIDYYGEAVVVRQIVGILARRIVCRVVEGQMLTRGERIGLMKFGSRMDVFPAAPKSRSRRPARRRWRDGAGAAAAGDRCLIRWRAARAITRAG
jgi:phosphatidylserine decarboxylase